MTTKLPGTETVRLVLKTELKRARLLLLTKDPSAAVDVTWLRLLAALVSTMSFAPALSVSLLRTARLFE